jgi:hypothetical protein
MTGASATQRRIVLAAFLFVSLPGVDAAAQSKGKFAVGGQFSRKHSVDGESHGSMGPGLLWRFGQSKQGWKYKYGLGWYSTQLDRAIGGDIPSEFGKLRVRPILGGYGYTHLIGKKTSIAASLLGGPAFTSFALSSDASDRFRSMLGAETIEAGAGHTFVLKPQISTWIDLNEKIGLNFTTGYVVARPTVTVRTPAGEDKRRVNADMMTFKVGMVYSVF